MVLDRVIVVDDFYCNWEDVAGNAHNQLEEVATTTGGNMNLGSIQDSFQKYMSHKIRDFPECAELDVSDGLSANGSFTREINDHPEKWTRTDWSGFIFLGFQDAAAGADTSRVVTLELEQGRITLKPNILVLMRCRFQKTPIVHVEKQPPAAQQQRRGPKTLDELNTTSSSPTMVFQMFHFNTHNTAFLARDHYVVIDRLYQHHVLDQVASPADCKRYIEAAETWATENNDGSWTRKRHDQYPTTDIPISYLTTVAPELVRLFTEKIFPVMEHHYLFPASEMSLQDLFIVKYDANAQSKLDWHRDVSLLSCNLALNEEFEGGGTSFSTLDDPVRIKTGQVIMHTGKLLHSGNHVTSGIRYIIVGFVKVDSDRVDYDFLKRTSRSGLTNEALFRNLLNY